jgi:hypothetical protein
VRHLLSAHRWIVSLSRSLRCAARGYHRTYGHAVNTILRAHGWRGFFAGFAVMVAGGVPRDAACLCGIEAAQRALTLLLFPGGTA